MKILLTAALSVFIGGQAFASADALFLYQSLKNVGVSETADAAGTSSVAGAGAGAGENGFWQRFVMQEKVPQLSCVANKKEKSVSCGIDRDNKDGRQIEFSGEVSKKLWKLLARNAECTSDGICGFAIDEVECKYVSDSSEFAKGVPSMAVRTSCLLMTAKEI